MTVGNCRFCGKPLSHLFCDLGMSPLANSYLHPDQIRRMEPFYPLRAYVCDACFLVQALEFKGPEDIFSDYAYFSSYSSSWLEHVEAYSEYMVERFGLDSTSQVMEIASNDGYLLQYFKERNIPILGIEPAVNVARVAQASGIPTLIEFFGVRTASELAAEGRLADLLVGNNVLAHVPDLNDFVSGMKIVLKPHGIITMEFPHLLRMMEWNQFDTIYHEHFSYFSIMTIRRIFAEHGLTVFDVEELPTHGGSLRIYARHASDETRPVSERVNGLVEREISNGLDRVETYSAFAGKVRETKRNLLRLLIQIKRDGRTIAGYGAPAKGNTLLNYCGIRHDFLDYTVDISPHKQGRYLPGTHIPIYHPDRLRVTRPDFLLILPWNLKDEIMGQMDHVRSWGGQFVVPIPDPGILP